jgi:hypothetical protein
LLSGQFGAIIKVEDVCRILLACPLSGPYTGLPLPSEFIPFPDKVCDIVFQVQP